MATDRKQQFNVYLSAEIVRQMKHHAIDDHLSLSGLVERVFTAYLAQPPAATQAPTRDGLALRPMLHVASLDQAVAFYAALGATVVDRSRDGDWARLRFGASELGLLARPPDPAQGEAQVELNFAYDGSIADLAERLRAAGVPVVRPVADDDFGDQLRLEDPAGMLVKINQTEPRLHG